MSSSEKIQGSEGLRRAKRNWIARRVKMRRKSDPGFDDVVPKDEMAKDAETEDGGLLTRIVARDPEALARLYDRYRGVVMAFALRVLRDRAEAEEAVVDVFHQVWRHAETFDAGRGSALAWIMTLCRSRAVDRLRQRG